MKRLRFWKLDAFTDGRSGGNPAALVCLDQQEELSDDEMQRLALEVAGSGFVSEVAFARPSPTGTISFRYFSREREVPFCGHATVAALYHLCSTRPEYSVRPRLGIETQRGMLEVENRVAAEQRVYIAAPNPIITPQVVSADRAREALGLPREAPGAGTGAELPIVECGQRCLLVHVSSLSILLGCAPSYPELRAFSDASGFEIVLLHSRETQLAGSAFRTRVFAPAFGYLEDPATGSGNAAFAHWLRQTGRWTDPLLPIEQGPSLDNPNLVTLRWRDDGALQIGGRAIARISGEYTLY